MSIYQNEYPHLKVELGKGDEQHLLWITLNNPEARNAISDEMIESLVNVLEKADYDPNIRAIILTGEGKCFCAGGDIKAMENKQGMFAGESNELRNRYMNGIQRIPRAIESLQTPLIAMVNGAAIGAGCDLTAMCDLRVASEHAKFGETFSKLSLVPGDGGTFFLQRVIGYPKAMEMFLTGDIYSASEAKEMGLVNRLVAAEELRSQTAELAKKIAGNAPVAISMTKKAMKAAYHSELNPHLELLASYQGIAQRTDDHFEALKAFKEKRNPIFNGH